MDNALKMNRSRLLEAIDHIDPRFIEETKVFYRNLPDLSSGEPNKKTAWLSLRRFAALAACLLLVSALIPIAHYLAVNLDAFIPSGIEGTTSAEESTETEYVDGDYLKPIKGLEPLPVGMIEDIDAAMPYDFGIKLNEVNHRLLGSDRYLGCYNGYYVIFDTMASGGMFSDGGSIINIDGYIFYYTSGFSMFAYKDGKIYDLGEIYFNGEITQDHLKTIYCRNNEYMRYFKPELKCYDILPINQKELEEINIAWEDGFGNGEILSETLDDIYEKRGVYCIGRYGASTFFQTSKGDHDVRKITISGFEFTGYREEFNLWVYQNNNIYSLEDAYQKGLVSYEDLAMLSYYNNIIGFSSYFKVDADGGDWVN